MWLLPCAGIGYCDYESREMEAKQTEEPHTTIPMKMMSNHERSQTYKWWPIKYNRYCVWNWKRNPIERRNTILVCLFFVCYSLSSALVCANIILIIRNQVEMYIITNVTIAQRVCHCKRPLFYPVWQLTNRHKPKWPNSRLKGSPHTHMHTVVIEQSK